MSTSTVTITASAVSSAISSVPLPTATKRNFSLPLSKDIIAENLCKILLKYTNWDDDCSLRLLKWGTKVLKLGQAAQDEKALEKLVVTKLNTLFKKILNNPLNPEVTLREPFLDRGDWIWEKSDLERYCELDKLSPFDHKEIRAIPHDFAREILVWTKQLNPEADQKEIVFNSSPHTALVKQSVISDLARETMINLFRLSALYAIERRNHRERRFQLKVLESAFKECIKKTEAQNKLDVEAFKKNQVDHTKRIEGKIFSIEQVQESTIQIFKGRLDHLSQRLEAERAFSQIQLNDMSQHLNAACASSQRSAERAAALERQVQYLNALYAQALHQMQNMPKEKKGVCVIC